MWTGAGGGDRTHDLLITNQLFFQLNYTGILELKDGIAPSSAEYETAVLLLNYSSKMVPVLRVSTSLRLLQVVLCH